MPFYKDKKRTGDLEQYAKENGYQFYTRDLPGMLGYMLDFKLFRQGGRKTIHNLMLTSGDETEDFSAFFDYRYTIQAGNTPVTLRQSVYFKKSRSLALPHFLMIPERWYHAIGKKFGMQDINFLRYPDFSSNYLLKGQDESLIDYTFDSPKLLEFFGRHKHWSLEGMGYYMILYLNKRLVKPNDIKSFINLGDMISDIFIQRSHDWNESKLEL